MKKDKLQKKKVLLWKLNSQKRQFCAIPARPYKSFSAVSFLIHQRKLLSDFQVLIKKLRLHSLKFFLKRITDKWLSLKKFRKNLRRISFSCFRWKKIKPRIFVSFHDEIEFDFIARFHRLQHVSKENRLFTFTSALIGPLTDARTASWITSLMWMFSLAEHSMKRFAWIFWASSAPSSVVIKGLREFCLRSAFVAEEEI